MTASMNRLLVITELFLPTKGGTAVWAAEVYRRLGGKEIHIVTADVPGAAEVDREHPNTIHRLDLRRLPWLRPESLAMYWRLFARSFRLANTRRFDAIHAFRALPEGLVGWAVSRLTFTPLVIYAHGEELTTWGRGGKYKAMRFALRRADRIVANSDHTCGELKRMGLPQDRILLINPGVDTAVFRPNLPCDDLRQSIGLTVGQKLILSVGRLSRRKGFDMVVRSLPELVARGLDARYALIGIGEDREYLAGLARSLGVSDRIIFLGHISASDLPRWYNACDVFVMPNREINGDNEGFGMVFVEAAACGRPAIAGRDGGTGSAIVEGETGYRVDGTKVDAVASAVADVLTDACLADRLGRAGQTRACHEFSWESVAAKTLAILEAK